MHLRNFFLAVSLAMPIVGTPLPANHVAPHENTAIERRIFSITQVYQDLFKREPLIEAVPREASSSVADEDDEIDILDASLDERHIKLRPGGPSKRGMKLAGGGPGKRSSVSDVAVEERKIKLSPGGPGKRGMKLAGGGPSKRSMKLAGGGPGKRTSDTSDAGSNKRRIKIAAGGPGN